MDASTVRQMASAAPDAGFWSALEAGQFRLPRCPGCERWMWPADWRCASCGTFGLDWTEVALEGVVYSWTKTWYPFVPERTDDLPYVVVLVELPAAGGSRLLGILTGDESALARGAPLTGHIEPPDDRTFGLPSVTWSLVNGSAS
jgi:uncharacterized OB-fold protein